MSLEILEVAPGPRPGTVLAQDGRLLTVPASWSLLPPGDAAHTRRVKASGPAWVVKEKRGRKMFSRGIYACADRIESVRAELETERADPAYARKLDAGRRRRAVAQTQYAEDFEAAVFRFLAFGPAHEAAARRLASAVAAHATPVGSGTVARTQRIPIERRAEAATIAWMRHQTTSYDHMHIPRVKGMRREVRRLLADRTRAVLGRYRRSESIDEALCPLAQALAKMSNAASK